MTKEEYKKKKLDLYRRITDNKWFDEIDAINSKICKKCGGTCCMIFPCAFSTGDFIDINDIDYMKSILDTGYFVIDSFVKYTDSEIVYYIRVRSKEEEAIVVRKGKRGSECSLHTKDGCMLDFYTRPTQGSLLIPCMNRYGLGVCDDEYDYKTMYNDWCEHQDVMKVLVDYYYNKEITPKSSKVNKLSKIIRKDAI